MPKFYRTRYWLSAVGVLVPDLKNCIVYRMHHSECDKKMFHKSYSRVSADFERRNFEHANFRWSNDEIGDVTRFLIISFNRLAGIAASAHLSHLDQKLVFDSFHRESLRQKPYGPFFTTIFPSTSNACLNMMEVSKSKSSLGDSCCFCMKMQESRPPLTYLIRIKS